MTFMRFLDSLSCVDEILIEAIKSGYSHIYDSNIIYHGGDIGNLKSLLRDFRILSPDEKRLLPSTGGGNVGLSATRNVKLARRYSAAFGNDRVLAIKDLGADKHGIDTNGDGIDMFMYDSDGNIKSEYADYDALVELDNGAEEEIRILKSDKFSPVGLI